MKIGVLCEWLCVVEFGVVVCVDGVDVMFLCVNYCLGVVMICFEFSYRRDASSVLYTGDFRFYDGMWNDLMFLWIMSDFLVLRLILIFDMMYCLFEYDDFLM